MGDYFLSITREEAEFLLVELHQLYASDENELCLAVLESLEKALRTQ